MGMYYERGGGYVLITRPQAMQQARGVGEEGGGVGEQQIRAPGDPYFSFSSCSFSLYIRRGFDKKFRSRQRRTSLMLFVLTEKQNEIQLSYP